MREEVDQASVRVEIDAIGDASTTAPGAAPDGSSRLPLIAGLIGLIVVGVLVLVARPDQEEGQEGPDIAADSAPFSSTTTDLATTDDELRITGEDLDLPPTTVGDSSALRNTNLGSEVQSVVPADRGWIALRSPNGASGPPRLMRSTDGIDWTFIETLFDLQDLDTEYVEYSNLVATDTGFAMLLMSFSELPSPDSDRDAVVYRLVSTLV